MLKNLSIVFNIKPIIFTLKNQNIYLIILSNHL